MKKSATNAGGALIGVMVVVAVLGVTALAVAQIFKTRGEVLVYARSQGELIDLKRYVTATVSLPLSAGMIGKTSCAPAHPNTLVKLYSRDFTALWQKVPPGSLPAQPSRVIIRSSAPFTVIGKWQVVATCTFTGAANSPDMEINIFGLKSGTTTWVNITKNLPLLFTWTVDMWSKHP